MKSQFNFQILIIIILCLTSCIQNPSKKEMGVVIQASSQEQKLKEIDKLVNKYPNSYITYENKLQILLSLKDIDNSILNCLKMIEIEPTNAMIKVQLGMLYILKNDNENADNQFTTAVFLYKKQLSEIKNNKNKKRIISMELYIPLCLLNKNEEAASLISDYIVNLSLSEKYLIEFLNSYNRLDIANFCCLTE